MNEPYTAAAIRILPPQEVANRFAFAQVAQLAAQYPSVAPEFIARLIEACVLSDFPIEQAVQRYLDKDRSIAITPELLEIHRALLDRQHRQRRVPS